MAPPVNEAPTPQPHPPGQQERGAEKHMIAGGVPGGYNQTALWPHPPRGRSDSDRQADRKGEGGVGAGGGDVEEGPSGVKQMRGGEQGRGGPAVVALRAPKGPGPYEDAAQWQRAPPSSGEQWMP